MYSLYNGNWGVYDEYEEIDVEEEPVVETAPIEQPVEDPVVEQPTEEPVVEQPVVEKPIEEPVVEQPIEEAPAEQPIETPPIEKLNNMPDEEVLALYSKVEWMQGKRKPKSKSKGVQNTLVKGGDGSLTVDSNLMIEAELTDPNAALVQRYIQAVRNKFQ